MAKKFSIEFVGNNDEQPIEDGAKERSCAQLINYLRECMGGCKNGDVTMKSRNSLVAATGTVTCADIAGADTVTINGTALTATQHHATGTVTIVIANTDVDDTVTINGVAFTAKNAEDTAARQFNISGTATQAATSLVACIAASAHASISGIVTAESAAGVVTIRAVASGTGGNSITLASSDADGLTVSGATLSGGAAVANNQFDHVGTDAQTATALAAAINASTTALVSDHVSASASNAVVTLTAINLGIAGNAVTLASSNGTRAAVSGARLTGGTESEISFTF